MRLFLFTFLIFSLLNCKSKKSINDNINTVTKQIFNLEECADGHQCSIELIPNSTLLIKQDKQQNSYIEIEKGDKTIVKYEFKRNEIPNTADAYYSEIIYFEIDKENRQLLLTNDALQSVKMMYARFCYCKDGTSGYFKVNQGGLKFTKNDNVLSISLNFKVGKIPQLLTEINETITLKEND